LGAHAIEIEQPEGRTDKRGQFVLPVSPPEQNVDDLFEQAHLAAAMPRAALWRGRWRDNRGVGLARASGGADMALTQHRKSDFVMLKSLFYSAYFCKNW
jgi:hypothetical protein